MGKNLNRLTLCLIVALLQGCEEENYLSRVIKIESVENEVARTELSPMSLDMTEDKLIDIEKTFHVGLVLDTVDERQQEWMNFIQAVMSESMYDFNINIKETTEETAQDYVTLMTDLIEEGSQVVIVPNNRCDNEVKGLIESYPNITFILLDTTLQGENVISVKFQHEVSSYLAGLMAGSQTKSNEVAYVAFDQGDEVHVGYEAFAKGVKSVNKQARISKVLCEYTDTSKRITEQTERLIEKNVDIIYEEIGSMRTTIESTLNQANSSALLIQSQFILNDAVSLNAKTMASVTYNLKPFIQMFSDQITEYPMKGGQYILGLENNGISVTLNETIVERALIEEIEVSINKIINGEVVY